MRPIARTGLLPGGVVLAPLAALSRLLPAGVPPSPTADGADAGRAGHRVEVVRRG